MLINVLHALKYCESQYCDIVFRSLCHCFVCIICVCVYWRKLYNSSIQLTR